MLSGESTPLLKESIQLLDASENLDVDGAHKNAVLFSGTKILQATQSSTRLSIFWLLPLNSHRIGEIPSPVKTPDGGCLGVVVRTGFGTAQGQLVRTMIFSTERVSANNTESFLFIGFLLIFAIAASWYVWVKGLPNSYSTFCLSRLLFVRYRKRFEKVEAFVRLHPHCHECCSSRASDGTLARRQYFTRCIVQVWSVLLCCRVVPF